MLRILNLLLLGGVVYSAFCLINIRYQARQSYTKLAALKTQADEFDKEYTRLQLEEGTFSSNLVLQDFAVNKLGLIQADKAHIIGIK